MYIRIKLAIINIQSRHSLVYSPACIPYKRWAREMVIVISKFEERLMALPT